jgi:hypothetical protein
MNKLAIGGIVAAASTVVFLCVTWAGVGPADTDVSGPMPAEASERGSTTPPAAADAAVPNERVAVEEAPIEGLAATEEGPPVTTTATTTAEQSPGQARPTLAELLTAGTTGEAPVDALVPESPAQRAAFAERALTAMSPGRLADIAFTELQQREAASLPAGMGDADRINALGLIARIAERDYAYRLELSKAIRQEIMTADLGRPARPASRGHSGVLSLAVTDAAVWGPRAPGTATAHYFVGFDKYPQVAALDADLRALRRELRVLTSRAE